MQKTCILATGVQYYTINGLLFISFVSFNYRHICLPFSLFCGVLLLLVECVQLITFYVRIKTGTQNYIILHFKTCHITDTLPNGFVLKLQSHFNTFFSFRADSLNFKNVFGGTFRYDLSVLLFESHGASFFVVSTKHVRSRSGVRPGPPEFLFNAINMPNICTYCPI